MGEMLYPICCKCHLILFRIIFKREPPAKRACIRDELCCICQQSHDIGWLFDNKSLSLAFNKKKLRELRELYLDYVIEANLY